MRCGLRSQGREREQEGEIDDGKYSTVLAIISLNTMPYTAKQHRLFEGVAHGSIPEKKGLTKGKAAMLAHEGVKKGEKKQAKKTKSYAHHYDK